MWLQIHGFLGTTSKNQLLLTNTSLHYSKDSQNRTSWAISIAARRDPALVSSEIIFTPLLLGTTYHYPFLSTVNLDIHILFCFPNKVRQDSEHMTSRNDPLSSTTARTNRDKPTHPYPHKNWKVCSRRAPLIPHRQIFHSILWNVWVLECSAARLMS